jgi:hypothetical protein
MNDINFHGDSSIGALQRSDAFTLTYCTPGESKLRVFSGRALGDGFVKVEHDTVREGGVAGLVLEPGSWLPNGELGCEEFVLGIIRPSAAAGFRMMVNGVVSVERLRPSFFMPEIRPSHALAYCVNGQEIF